MSINVMIIFWGTHRIDALMIDEQAGAYDIAAAAFSWLKCEGVEVASGDDASSDEHE